MAALQIDPESVDPTTLPEVGLQASLAGADRATLASLAAYCQGCDLWERATQTVFGEGPRTASIVLIGEQPGDQEDRAGHPFVGPAGRVLNDALAQAGIDREKTFVTNVVKHFKWKPVPGSKRRLHELLGATAAQSVLGPDIRVSETAGRLIDSDLASMVVATIHPSVVLRGRDSESRDALLARLVGDLRPVAKAGR